MRSAALWVLMLAGCTGSTQSACEDYLASVQACYDAAGVEYDTSVYVETCSLYEGFSDGNTTEVFVCLSDAWDDHDCTEGEALEPDCG